MRRFRHLRAAALSLVACAGAALAQEAVTGGEYSLDLPNQTWKALSRPDGLHQHTEFVNGDRMDGFLRVRKEVVDAATTPPEMARRDQDLKLRYLSGFVGGKEERFAGRLGGVVLSYEYTGGGKAMAGRIYYLQSDNRTVYTLHFTGLRDRLLRIQNQTDSIARSFRLN